jgi:uncharacterized repeat protein (TIGR03803 family)
MKDSLRYRAYTRLRSTVVLLVIVLVTGAIEAQMSGRPTLTVLHSFGNGADGSTPGSTLIRDKEGNFYGTTNQGGAAGYGTVYKLDNTGHETVLHSFNLDGGGAFVYSDLIRDIKGNLYGTTFVGGNLSFCGGVGCGVVFKVDSSGTETVLYAFTGTGGDGAFPVFGALVRDSAGNLYGTTGGGGNVSGPCANNGLFGCGTVFKIDTSGKETVLYAFTGGQDGASPAAGVIRDASGSLYGGTYAGGNLEGVCANNVPQGCGVVFKLDNAGHETVLHTFSGMGGDGSVPHRGLMRDSAGNIYGTTENGGTATKCPTNNLPGCGTVFKIDTSGKETVLHSFTGNRDGSYPDGRLILDGHGNLYGVVSAGGLYGAGGIFEITASGQLITIFHFTNDGAEPKNPEEGLFRDTEGNLYGTTRNGGPYLPGGAVFKVTFR